MSRFVVSFIIDTLDLRNENYKNDLVQDVHGALTDAGWTDAMISHLWARPVTPELYEFVTGEPVRVETELASQRGCISCGGTDFDEDLDCANPECVLNQFMKRRADGD
jgi:hypothetical protein